MRATKLCRFVSASPTNRHFWVTLPATAPPKRIWSLWTNVPNWRQWDTGLESARANTPSGPGGTGEIVADGRTSTFTVIEYTTGKSYTIRTGLLGAALHVRRFLKDEKNTTTLTHEVWFSGPLAFIFAGLFGAKFRRLLPDVVAQVNQLAHAH